MDKVIIVMPAWNEEENIKKMIVELVDKEFPHVNAQMHLLVVDNYSKDKTKKVVEEAAKTRQNIHIIEQGKKSGLGWAYINGFKYAMEKLGADAVMEMDADFQHPPRFVGPMVEAYLNGADYVIGSRYVKGGSIPKEWELFRKAVSYFGNLFIRIVLLKPSIHDVTTGFRLTKVKGVLDQIDLDKLREPGRFSHKIDLLYQSIKHARKVVEVPLQFAARTQEKSKFNPKETFSSFRLAIILGILDKIRFIKFATVGFIGYLVNAICLKVLTNLEVPGFIAWSLPVELAIISNFVLNNIWTFKSERITGLGKLIRKFLAFNGTSLGALLIQTIAGLIGDLIFGIGNRQYVLPFIILFLVLPYNYFMYNAVIWKTWKLPWNKK